MAKTRRTFTRESKLEAIERVTEQGRSLKEVSRDLEIGESTLRSWKQALTAEGDQAFPDKGNLPAQEDARFRPGGRGLPVLLANIDRV